jgi:hypothetical protein
MAAGVAVVEVRAAARRAAVVAAEHQQHLPPEGTRPASTVPMMVERRGDR